MDDTISRQVAIDALEARKDKSAKGSIGCFYNTIIQNDIDTLKDLPPAEPEITHCAECIHWKHSAARKSYCEVFDWMSKAEDFCSFAERRTDG